MKHDKQALERIQELEHQLEDAHIVIDLLRESMRDNDIIVTSLKGQLQQLRIDRRYELA